MMKTNNFLGFDSLADFGDSLFRLKDWSITGLFALIGGISTMITNYMYDTPEAIWTLWILMFLDWGTGIFKSMKKKEFVSYKLFRMPLYFVATSIIVSLSWWMAKSSMIFYLLPGLVVAGFYAVYFISLAENLGELGYLPKTLVAVLKSRFGLKVVVDKYFKNNEDAGMPASNEETEK